MATLGIKIDPKTAKTIGRAAAISIAAIVALWLLIRLRRFFINEVTNQEVVKEANKEIDASQITLTDAQYNTLASKFYLAVKGWGTDVDSVYAVFEALQSRSDLLKLFSVFGVKDDMTFVEWVYDDLSQKEIDHVNQILAANNINYKF